MARLQFNNILGTSLTFSSNITSTGIWNVAPNFPSITSPDYAVVVVEPGTPNEEITYLTTYISGSVTGTFERAQEGTAGIIHLAKPWGHNATVADFEEASAPPPQEFTGNPLGVVTPNAVHIFGIDTDQNSLFWATGSTSDDWVQVAGRGYEGQPNGVSSTPTDGTTFADNNQGIYIEETGSTGLIEIQNDGTNGILIHDQGGGGIGLNESAGGSIIIGAGGSGSGGLSMSTGSDNTGGVTLQDAGGGGITIEEVLDSSDNPILISNQGNGGTTLEDVGTGNLVIAKEGNGHLYINGSNFGGIAINTNGGSIDIGNPGDKIILYNLPTSDPSNTGEIWAYNDQVVLSGFSAPIAGIPYQVFSGSPIGSVVPTAAGYLGEDTTNHRLYLASSNTNTSWVQISGPPDSTARGFSGSSLSGFVTMNGLNSGLKLADSSGGISLVESAGTVGISITNNSSANGIVIEDNSSTQGIVIEANGTGGILALVQGNGGIELHDTGSGSDVFILPNLPTTDPATTGELWNYEDTVVVSGFIGAIKENVVATSGSTQTLAYLGNDITLSASCTFTMPTAVRGAQCYARLHQASAASYTATFTGVLWPAGTPPTMTATHSATDLFEFQSDGTHWLGITAGQNFA